MPCKTAKLSLPCIPPPLLASSENSAWNSPPLQAPKSPLFSLRYPFYSVSIVKHNARALLGRYISVLNKFHVCYRRSAGLLQLQNPFPCTQAPGLWSWMPCRQVQEQLEHQGSQWCSCPRSKEGKLEILYTRNQAGSLTMHRIGVEVERDTIQAKKKIKGKRKLPGWFFFFKGSVHLKVSW